jgi:Ca2+/H+ antiporter, TMEM165/GDT1 family
MTLAYAVVDGLAVWAGSYLSSFIPDPVLKTVAGLLFMIFGVASFFLSDEESGRSKDWLTKIRKWGPFWVSFLAIGISEFADRTQLSAATLSAETGRPLGVFLGVMSALVVLNGITVWIGKSVAERISQKTLKLVAGISFLAAGLYLLSRVFLSKV